MVRVTRELFLVSFDNVSADYLTQLSLKALYFDGLKKLALTSGPRDFTTASFSSNERGNMLSILCILGQNEN